MKLYNTADPQAKPPVSMVLYGEGGVGKSTFASTAPKPIMADCENGAKYFGLRGIKMDVAVITSWSDMKEFIELVQKGDYETVIIDPIGELMEKLMRFMVAQGDRKLVQADGSPSMAGWGWLKKTMRNYLKAILDSGKHVLIIAHIDEREDEGRMIKRPLLATKLSAELVTMVDIVGYMTSVKDESDNIKRIILVDGDSDKYEAKDRTDQLNKVVEPDFQKIVKAVQGIESYAWSKPAKAPAEPKAKAVKPKEVAKPQEEEEDLNLITDEEAAKAMGNLESPSKRDVLQDKLAKAKGA